MDTGLEGLGLDNRVTEALGSAGLSLGDLFKMSRQELIDLPGIGEVSADRIIAALGVWVEQAIALRQAPTKELTALPLSEEPVVLELLDACVWAQKVLQGIGGQRGMFLAAQMRQKIEAVQEVITVPLGKETLVTEVVPR